MLLHVFILVVKRAWLCFLLLQGVVVEGLDCWAHPSILKKDASQILRDDAHRPNHTFFNCTAAKLSPNTKHHDDRVACKTRYTRQGEWRNCTLIPDGWKGECRETQRKGYDKSQKSFIIVCYCEKNHCNDYVESTARLKAKNGAPSSPHRGPQHQSPSKAVLILALLRVVLLQSLLL